MRSGAGVSNRINSIPRPQVRSASSAVTNNSPQVYQENDINLENKRNYEKAQSISDSSDISNLGMSTSKSNTARPRTNLYDPLNSISELNNSQVYLRDYT